MDYCDEADKAMQEKCDQDTADLELGRLVRKMYKGFCLEREGWSENAWNVHWMNGEETELSDTPELALQRAYEAMKDG